MHSTQQSMPSFFNDNISLPKPTRRKQTNAVHIYNCNILNLNPCNSFTPFNDQYSPICRNQDRVEIGRRHLWPWRIYTGTRTLGRIWPKPVWRGRGRTRACCCGGTSSPCRASIWNGWTGWLENHIPCTATVCKSCKKPVVVFVANSNTFVLQANSSSNSIYYML